MFENKYFYHSVTKNAITAFGSLFNSIVVRQEDGDDLNVGLSFAPKEHFVAILNKKTENINQYLPRMSFEFSKPIYDKERETDPFTRIGCIDSDGIRSSLAPVPYIFDIQLHTWVKYLDHEYQIYEQILPYFRPIFTMALIGPDGGSIDMDIEIQDLDGEDNFETEIADKRIVTSTINFKAKVLFYAPIEEDGEIIKHISLNYNDPSLPEGNDKICETNITVVPWEANPDDDFTVQITNGI